MSKSSSIKITDLSPESASKVFQFLHIFLEEKQLDVDYFKEELPKFTLEQQYFIFVYAKSYFINSEGGYLDRLLKRQERIYTDEETSQKFLEYASLITKNASKIFNIIDSNQLKVIEKKMKGFIANNNAKEDFITKLATKPCNYRIPLYIKYEKIDKEDIEKKRSTHEISSVFNNFKEDVFNILKPILNPDQIEQFFYNSFAFHSNVYPIELLHFEITSKEIFNSCVRQLNKTYKNDVLPHVEKYTEDYNEKYNKRDKFNSVNRVEFMIVMYNTFPQIRDSYLLYLQKDPSRSLIDFLNTQISNI
jgi:hypothetical protein